MMEYSIFSVVKQIYDQFQQDPRCQEADIGVGYNQGILILTGTVSSAEIAQAAEEIVRYHPGVSCVINKIKIEPQPALPDNQPKEEIYGKSKTWRDRFLNFRNKPNKPEN